jgi:thiamine biosynthesis lipoprotein
MLLPVTDIANVELIEAQAAAALQAGSGYVFHDPCVLGTRLNVVVDAVSQDVAYRAACAARVEIDRLDPVFNWRDPGSELSRLNASRVIQASRDLFDVVAAAEAWRALSGGAYSGRLGVLLEAWRGVAERLPEPGAMQALARQIASAEIRLEAETRTIVRSEHVRFDLDGIAKGYIVDRALEAAMAVAGVSRAMVDIGGDVRCAGRGAWRIELPQPLSPFDNAPACGAFAMSDGAVATSGCGPRDRQVGADMISATIDPRTGWPVSHWRSATAVGPSAMAADALATAMLVLSSEEAGACIQRVKDMAARVTRPGGVTWLGQQRGEPSPQWIEYAPQKVQGAGAPSLWKEGWYANVTFSAPPKDMRREIAFRSPYVAIWISGLDNKPVRTLFMVGRYKEWHEGNHVWWRQNRAKLDTLFARSLSTRGSGTYKVYWDGVDDDGRPVLPGRYRINVETSREGGGHSHRYMDMDFSQPRVFEQALPMQPDNGGLEVSFQKF